MVRTYFTRLASVIAIISILVMAWYVNTLSDIFYKVCALNSAGLR